MKKVPVNLIPVLNAGAENQVVPYENTMDGFKSDLNGLMVRGLPNEYKDYIATIHDKDTIYDNCTMVDEWFDFAVMLNRLVCFPEEKRRELPDSFLWTLWRFVKVKHNFCPTPTWCVYDPFLICTDSCSYCGSLDEGDQWNSVGWTFEELDWLIQDEEMLPAWE